MVGVLIIAAVCLKRNTMETVSKNMRKIMSIRVDRYAVMVVFLIIAAVSLPVIYKLYTLADLWM